MRIFSFLSVVLSFTAVSLAGPLALGTFSVTGSGTFHCDPQDATAGFTFSFSGANAGYQIMASSPGLGGSFAGNNLQFPCFATVGDNTVIADTVPPSFDFIQQISAGYMPAGSGNWTFSDAAIFQLGNGTGYLDIYDNASAMPGNPANLVATATLSGFVTVTSISETPPPFAASSGEFQIGDDPPGGTDAPEPGTFALLAAGAFLLRGYLAFARG